MLIYIKNFSKEIRQSFFFLYFLLKNIKLIDILTIISVIDQLVNKKIKYLLIKSIKYLYYKKILGKKKGGIFSKKRYSNSNIYVETNLKKKRGMIYSVYKGNKKKKCLKFDLIVEKTKQYNWIFHFCFLPKSTFKIKMEKLLKMPKYKRFFIWPFYITIKPKVVILKNIFFKNFFVLKYKDNTNILSWIECKNKYKSTENILNKVNIIHLNMLNNYFIKNNKIIIFNKKKNNIKCNIFGSYLRYLSKRNIKGYFYFLNKYILDFKFKKSKNFFKQIFKVLISVIKKEILHQPIKNNFNISFWNSDNKIFNKGSYKKNISFFKFKKYIRKYAKKSLINYSFFLRLYMLYFFWFIFFFNKIFYYFNKILFNFWFRFFYFLNSSLNINNKLFFSYKNLYKSLTFIKYVNFYFEFENIFINYLYNLTNTFYWNIKYILINEPNKIYFSKYILLYFLFIFKNYFFLNIYYIYNKYLKNIINQTFILENNLFDSLYSNNYKYDTIYNKNYFLIKGNLTKKLNRFYVMPEKKKKIINGKIIRFR